jgi:hypothetical protein
MLAVFLVLPSRVAAEVPQEEEEEEYSWYSVYVSDPDGNGGGKPVVLQYTAEPELPANGKYSWYSCDEEGAKEELLSVTDEPWFETEGFSKKQIRYYLCELNTDGPEYYDSELYAVGLTGLPLIRITTENGEKITSVDDYIPGTITVLDEETVLEQPINVKGRGNATFFYPKKPYTVKLEEKAGLLGMGKAKKWALLAGYCDKTLLRVAVGFQTSELLDLAYTPDYRYVDLVINGQYLGNYILAETVKEEAKQLDIGEDGYLVEETQYGTDDPIFFTEMRSLRYRFRYPDGEKVTTEIMESVTAEINKMEQALLNLDAEADIPGQVDTDSWVNWFLVQNILANMDTNRYYYRIDSDSKICMGPVWDFEWSLGIGWYNGDRPCPDHSITINTAYLRKLLENTAFRQRLKERWNEIYPDITEKLTGFMDETARVIEYSRRLNFYRWWILDRKIAAGGIPMGSYEAEVECDETYLREHVRWLNDEITGME